MIVVGPPQYRVNFSITPRRYRFSKTPVLRVRATPRETKEEDEDEFGVHFVALWVAGAIVGSAYLGFLRMDPRDWDRRKRMTEAESACLQVHNEAESHAD